MASVVRMVRDSARFCNREAMFTVWPCPGVTAWAVEILNRPALYPIFSATLRTFGTQTVMARVEWHPPDFQNNAVHRGVTLYVP